jgi:hypothetical protein
MQRLEVSGAVRPIYVSLGVKRLSNYLHCYMLSGRDLCDELIPRSEESYRLLYAVVCDLETP